MPKKSMNISRRNGGKRVPPPAASMKQGNVSTNQNRKLAGLIELQYGEPNWMNWNNYNHVPKRRDIIIFPSWLRHTVYAHYEENCVRVSVAGNVNIVG